MNPVQPYAGQNQVQTINVPASIAYKSYKYSPEDGPWAMLSYATLYPGGETAEAVARGLVPPPVEKTDLWMAMQTYPL